MSLSWIIQSSNCVNSLPLDFSAFRSSLNTGLAGTLGWEPFTVLYPRGYRMTLTTPGANSEPSPVGCIMEMTVIFSLVNNNIRLIACKKRVHCWGNPGNKLPTHNIGSYNIKSARPSVLGEVSFSDLAPLLARVTLLSLASFVILHLSAINCYESLPCMGFFQIELACWRKFQ